MNGHVWSPLPPLLPETVLLVVSFLGVNDKFRLSQVSRSWRQWVAAAAQTVWQSMVLVPVLQYQRHEGSSDDADGALNVGQQDGAVAAEPCATPVLHSYGQFAKTLSISHDLLSKLLAWTKTSSTTLSAERITITTCRGVELTSASSINFCNLLQFLCASTPKLRSLSVYGYPPLLSWGAPYTLELLRIIPDSVTDLCLHTVTLPDADGEKYGNAGNESSMICLFNPNSVQASEDALIISRCPSFFRDEETQVELLRIMIECFVLQRIPFESVNWKDHPSVRQNAVHVLEGCKQCLLEGKCVNSLPVVKNRLNLCGFWCICTTCNLYGAYGMTASFLSAVTS
eukprot:TRINITY_DN6119_c0_g1_i1.p1 TRINITY_DN6119_c0_g1~~TRINITY_DN6119_c0_g1_i1.p1  ORF type:complete len:342 (+),score=71.64 TRINITY_DN6119_c0_g1_i1:11-1036(+)